MLHGRHRLTTPTPPLDVSNLVLDVALLCSATMAIKTAQLAGNNAKDVDAEEVGARSMTL